MSINSVNVSGRLTRDPELRIGKTAILKIPIAVNDRRKVEGEWMDVPNYVDCTVFGTRAEALARKLAKGSLVAVSGKLRWSSWQAQDGSRRDRLEVAVDELEILGEKEPTELYDGDCPF